MKTDKELLTFRRKVKRLQAKNLDIKEIMRLTRGTYYQVYNVMTGRVKLDPPIENHEAVKIKSQKKNMHKKSIKEFKSIEEFLEYQLIEASKLLSKDRIKIEDRLKYIKDIANIQKNIVAQKLESWIKKPEAILIVKIMKRLSPKITEEEVRKIYQEEYEKLVRGID